MILPDVNVVVYALNDNAPQHNEYRDWMEAVVNGPNAFALSEFVLSGVVRILTHPKIFSPPSPLGNVVSELEKLRTSPNCVLVSPSSRHWKIFTDLCVFAAARGNLVSDAYLAALAIETGCELITADRDFARFPGLTWRHPLGY